MDLTRNFSLKEMIRSQKASEKNIDNRPSYSELKNLFLLAYYILQPTRDEHGRLDITSGFRCPALNQAIGGSLSSRHVRGEAADFQSPEYDLKEVFNWMAENLKFGQLIYEHPPGRNPWIHVSLPRIGKDNGQVLRYDGENYTNIEGRLI